MAIPKAFRLSSLLNLRKAQEERAAAELAQAAADRARAEQRRMETEKLLGTVAFTPGSAAATSFQAVTATRATMSMMLTEAVTLAESAAAHQDTKRRDYQAAHAKTLTLTKLEERHVEAFNAEQNRNEQIVLDEIASTRARKQEPQS